MSIGIIAEGKGDLGVLDQILKGITGLDTSNFKHIRPSEEFDETDLNNPDRRWSTWSLVRQECIDGSAIESYLQLEDSRFVVIHIDTDSAKDYGVIVPKRDSSYCQLLRSNVVAMIKSWLNGRFENKIHFAVAIEEIEAWLLTIYDKSAKETSLQPNPKKSLSYILSKRGENTTSNYENYKRLSKHFAKAKDVLSSKCLDFNCSLRLFYEEFQQDWNDSNQIKT
jgi:hypothetical protein